MEGPSKSGGWSLRGGPPAKNVHGVKSGKWWGTRREGVRIGAAL